MSQSLVCSREDSVSLCAIISLLVSGRCIYQRHSAAPDVRNNGHHSKPEITGVPLGVSIRMSTYTTYQTPIHTSRACMRDIYRSCRRFGDVGCVAFWSIWMLLLEEVAPICFESKGSSKVQAFPHIVSS